MAKVLHLSKLSRGHVEMSESGSQLEIYADQNVCIYFCLFKKIKYFFELFYKNLKKNIYMYLCLLGKNTS